MTKNDPENGATVAVMRKSSLSRKTAFALIVLVVAQFVFLLVVSSSNSELREENSGLREQKEKAERLAEERSEEVREMVGRCIPVVRNTLDELGKVKQEPADGPNRQPVPKEEAEIKDEEPEKL